MLRKVLFAAAFTFGVHTAYAQAPAATPAQKAQKSADGVVKFIDAKITTPTGKLTPAEKQAILKAYLDCENGLADIKTKQEKLAADKNKIEELNNEIKRRNDALSQKGAVTTSSQEEADKINAENEKEREAIKALIEQAKQASEQFKAEGASLPKAADLYKKRDEAVKAALAADKAKIFADMRAAQQAKQ